MSVSRQRAVSARPVLGVAISLGLHVGLPWIATRFVAASTAPSRHDIRLLDATLALEPPSGDAMIGSRALAPRELAARPAPAPSARPPRHQARATARPIASEVTSATERSSETAMSLASARAAATSKAAHASSHSTARGAAGRDRPSSSASGSMAGRSSARAAVLARYLSAARERVMRHRQYPHLARRARLEGTVCLRVTITASGQVRTASVTCGGSHELLVRAALQSVEAAAPFAPLPAELGRELTLELPVVFELAM
jgi:periplasmic protein TonB